jgi:bifunctional UDP-N-acetylglucosamine pyrophosphorylase/glucosamine-1-phosphate N-acetyltransferase
MTNGDTAIIILAAGKGKRMGIDIPKVLVSINGKPMIDYVIDAVNGSRINGKPIVVYGPGVESVQNHVGERGTCVLQEQQLGTAHAVKSARDVVGSARCVAVLNGDNPFISSSTIARIAEYHDKKPCPIIVAIGTVDSYDGWKRAFKSFGRVLRDEHGLITAIREAKDATEEELAVREVNSGFYVFDGAWLWENLDKVSNNNAQGEYYLTDLVQFAVDQKLPVRTFSIPIEECIGVNRLDERDIAEMVAKNNSFQK